MSGPLARPHTRPAALAPAVEEFLADCRLRGLSPTTVAWYKYALEPFLRFAAARGEPASGAMSRPCRALATSFKCGLQ